MTKITDFLNSLSLKERGELLRELSKKVRKPEIKRVIPEIKVISKRSLSKSLREGLTDKQLAEAFNVSERTITRRIKEYKLKGLRPFGKKPLKPEWVLTHEYIRRIRRIYHLVYTQAPKKKYINSNDKICSNNRDYPKGKYFAYSTYFIVNYDGVRQMFMRIIQYTEKSVPFKEIKEYALRRTYEILTRMFRNASFWVEDIIAYEFLTKKEYSIILPDYKTDLNKREEKGEKNE